MNLPFIYEDSKKINKYLKYLERLIKNKIIYVDKIIIWFNKNPKINRDILNKNSNGSIHIYKKAMFYNKKWKFRITINQPKSSIWTYFKINIPEKINFLITLVEISYDFITNKESEADKIKRFFESFLIKKWHRNQKIKKFEDTVYYGSRGTDRNNNISRANINFAFYSDKISKITSEYCFHFEIRLQNSNVISKYGFNNFDSFIKNEFKSNEFWKKFILFKRIKSLEKLGKAVINQLYRKKITKTNFYDNLDKLYGMTILKGYATDSEYPDFSCQKFMDNIKDLKNKKKIFNNIIKIETSVFDPL